MVKDNFIKTNPLVIIAPKINILITIVNTLECIKSQSTLRFPITNKLFTSRGAIKEPVQISLTGFLSDDNTWGKLFPYAKNFANELKTKLSKEPIVSKMPDFLIEKKEEVKDELNSLFQNQSLLYLYDGKNIFHRNLLITNFTYSISTTYEDTYEISLSFEEQKSMEDVETEIDKLRANKTFIDPYLFY